MITRRGSLTGITMRGGLGTPVRFAVDWVRIETVITPGDIEEQTIDDAVFEVSIPATVDYEAQAIIRPTHPDADVSQITWSVSESAIASIDASGKVTRITDGYIRIIATDHLGARAISGLIHIYRDSGVESRTFVRWVEGSLAKAAADAIDSRIADADPQTDMAIFTTQDHANGIYVRNPDCWAADLDLTGISPWNSRSGALRAGVAISPRDVLTSEHYPLQVGNTIRFVAADNTVVTRTIAAVKNVGPANSSDGYVTDFQVCTLDEDLPAEIKYYSVLPAEWADYIRHLNIGLPTLGLDQEEKALVQDLYSLGAFAVHRTPSDSQRLAFYESKITGDSGNPSLLILDDEPVLVTLWTFGGAGSGPNIARLHDLINAAMTANGSPYQLTVADLSGWTNFAEPVYPPYEAMLIGMGAVWVGITNDDGMQGLPAIDIVNNGDWVAREDKTAINAASTPYGTDSFEDLHLAAASADPILSGFDDFTLAVWIRIGSMSGGSTRRKIWGVDASGNRSWLLIQAPRSLPVEERQIEFELWTDNEPTTVVICLVDDLRLPTTGQRFLVVRRDGGTLTCWIDGVQVSSHTVPSGKLNTSAAAMEFGDPGSNQGWIQAIHCPVIFRRALSDQEIVDIYNAGRYSPGRNMLLNTEDFTQDPWTRLQGMTVLADQGIAPDGTMTADLLIASQTASRIGGQSNILEQGERVTASIYVKYVNQDRIAIRLWSSSASPNDLIYARYQFSDDSFYSVTGGGLNKLTTSEPVGNGWVRIIASCDVHDTSDFHYLVYSGDSTTGTYGETLAWGAQLEKGPVTPYEPRGGFLI